MRTLLLLTLLLALTAAPVRAQSVPAKSERAALAEVTTQGAYMVPFASEGNVLELAVANTAAPIAGEVAVIIAETPAWLVVVPAAVVLAGLEAGEESPATFTFSVAQQAPVGEVAVLRFAIRAQGALLGEKEIRLEVEAPQEIALRSNYPNPFNPQTTIFCLALLLPATGLKQAWAQTSPQVNLSTDKQTYLLGEPIVLTMALTNVSDSLEQYGPLEPWGARLLLSIRDAAEQATGGGIRKARLNEISPQEQANQPAGVLRLEQRLDPRRQDHIRHLRRAGYFIAYGNGLVVKTRDTEQVVAADGLHKDVDSIDLTGRWRIEQIARIVEPFRRQLNENRRRI